MGSTSSSKQPIKNEYVYVPKDWAQGFDKHHPPKCGIRPIQQIITYKDDLTKSTYTIKKQKYLIYPIRNTDGTSTTS